MEEAGDYEERREEESPSSSKECEDLSQRSSKRPSLFPKSKGEEGTDEEVDNAMQGLAGAWMEIESFRGFPAPEPTSGAWHG